MRPLRIHGVWYDVSRFKHPGGPVMLSLGEGRDATALFESHHPFTPRATLENILRKYRIEESAETKLLDKREQEDLFVWPEYETKDDSPHAPVTAFAEEVRTKVQSYFEGEAKRRGVPLLEATKATPTRWLEILLYAVIAFSTFPAYIRGEWWSLLATPLTYWVLGVNTFHDGSHFALSRNWRVNAVATYIGWWFSSPLEWYHQHVIGHHAYPNIPERDPDLYHNGKMERHTKTLRWRPLHSHQPRTWLPIWWIGTFAMSYLKPLQMLMTNWYNRSVFVMPLDRKRKLQHVLGRVMVFCLCHVWQFFVFSPLKAFAFSSVPVGVVSLCFMLSSQVNHLTPENIDVSSRDFYAHQVMTSHTFAIRDRLSFIFTGGLNFQIEHHLFPTVNHCHLRKIQPIVKQACIKHNVPYHESKTMGEAFSKYLQHMHLLSRP